MAILLGMVLAALRGLTTASNFTFFFMALTIVVAELGGRRAAVATALCSALSLNFFLTKPYLRLTIHHQDDIIAFLGLAICGLIAAAFGSRLGERSAELRSVPEQPDIPQGPLVQLELPASVDPKVIKVLDAARLSLPLAAAVVRDGRDYVLAASSDGPHPMPVPTQVLQPDTLLPRGISAREMSGKGLAFPAEGGRLALVVGNRQIGWLDLWGNRAPASLQARRSLSELAQVLAALLAEGSAPARG